jgi:hypothetical protein
MKGRSGFDGGAAKYGAIDRSCAPIRFPKSVRPANYRRMRQE